ncbi:hypothetical protein P3L10_028364 [Capsicum annuum]
MGATCLKLEKALHNQFPERESYFGLQNFGNTCYCYNLQLWLNVTSVKDLPAILLVHGIFGFEKRRLGGLSYFVGAEKKDDRVLVPDLIFGSPNDDLSNSNMTSEFKNKPDGWETTSKTQDGNIWEMSKREEDILVQEFERRIAFNKFQVCACDTNCCNAFVVPACSGNYKGVTEDVGCSYIVVTNRTECCQGLEQDITSKISAGCVYTVSARAGVSENLLRKRVVTFTWI